MKGLNAHAVFLFAKYTFVATIGLVFDMTMLYVLVEFVHIQVMVSTALAYIATTFLAFFLHKRFTFHDHAKGVTRQITSFFVISGMNFVLTIILMYVFVDLLAIWYMLSKFVTATILLFFSYAMNRLWTFKGKY